MFWEKSQVWQLYVKTSMKEDGSGGLSFTAFWGSKSEDRSWSEAFCKKRKRGVIPMYNLRSGHLTIVHQNHAHANVGAYARCHRIVIYNLSRIEVRVQQQKRYMAILCFCFPCGWCKYRNFVSNNQQKEYFLDKLKIISVIDVSCQKWVIYLRQFLIPVKLDRNRK